jgi:hypothetical protein
MDALSALVASVSHNALASVLPGKAPSNQQQFSGKAHPSWTFTTHRRGMMALWVPPHDMQA